MPLLYIVNIYFYFILSFTCIILFFNIYLYETIILNNNKGDKVIDKVEIDKVDEDNVVHYLEILLRDIKDGTHQKKFIAPLIEKVYQSMYYDGMFGSEGQCDPRGDHRG